MKKTLLLLLALTTAAVAGEYGVTLLEVDFTKVSELPSGWSEGSDNGSGFSFFENGASPDANWKKNWMGTTLSLSSHTASQISFELYNNIPGAANMMYLSSSSYSIVIGNSHYDGKGDTTNDGVYVGLLSGAVSKQFFLLSAYATSQGTTITKTDITESRDAVYTLTFADGVLSVNIVDTNDKEWSRTYPVPDVTFDTIGFIVNTEYNKNGVKSVSVRTVPEPATSVLSLLSLAGLAARRRRR